jgi:hypothetical protein
MSTECQTALIGAGLVSPQGTSHNLTVEKDALNMSRFLNRILGLPVKLQNQLFSYFTDTLAAVCQQAKKLGKWDGGIQDFGAQGEKVEVVETKEYVGDPAFCTATTQLVKVSGNQQLLRMRILNFVTMHVICRYGVLIFDFNLILFTLIR